MKMAQTSILINVLKRQLKAQGKTYTDVAVTLDLSEASVKRLFAEQNFTLQRLETIGELLGFELSDLMLLVLKQQSHLKQLSIQQEKEIAADIVLLLVTVCVINGYTLQDILDKYTIPETECVRKLAKLDRLKIIELQPNNRIKLLISPNFKWLTNGPIQQFFQQEIQQDFFNSTFNKETEKLVVLNGMLSIHSIKKLHKKIQSLTDEVNYLIKEDATLPINEKLGITMVMAERQWKYSIFDNYRKQNQK